MHGLEKQLAPAFYIIASILLLFFLDAVREAWKYNAIEHKEINQWNKIIWNRNVLLKEYYGVSLKIFGGILMWGEGHGRPTIIFFYLWGERGGLSNFSVGDLSG